MGRAGLSTSIVCKKSGNWLGNELEYFKTRIVCGLGKGGFLLLTEVGRNCNDSSIDLLSSVVRGRLYYTLEVPRSNLRDGDN